MPLKTIQRDVYLTFDVEGFKNPKSLTALANIIKTLNRHNLRGLFFITAEMAETLAKSHAILRLLEDHDVGYHSSAHYVRPSIPEFTDVKSYDEAVKISLIRETSRINPLTGEPEGEGGIKILREIFNNKDIIAFRAPGHIWTPPHLNALQKIGIKIDFSAKIFQNNVQYNDVAIYKSVCFCPFPKSMESPLAHLPYHLCRRKKLCLESHEWEYINSDFKRLNFLLEYLERLQRLGLVRVVSLPDGGNEIMSFTKSDILKTYYTSIRYPRWLLNYGPPKYLLSHFFRFFGLIENTYKS